MKKYLFLFLHIVLLQVKQELFAQKQGQLRIDSLLTQIPKATEDTNKINLLNDLCNSYTGINPDEGITYGNQALALAERLIWKKGIANANLRLGIIYYNGKSDIPKALEYYSNASYYFEDLGDRTGLAKVAANTALVYSYLSDYPKALEYHFKALKAFEEMGNKKGIATVFHNIGNVYEAQFDYPKALEYYFKSLKIGEEIGENKIIAYDLESIGVVYNYKKDYLKALEYMLRALKISEELGDKDEISTITNSMGTVYEDQKDYPKALEYYSNALKICKESGTKGGIAANVADIGSVYLKIAKDTTKVFLNKLFNGNKTKALQMAKEYFSNAIVLIKDVGNLTALFACFQDLSEIQTLLGDNKGALESYKFYSTIKDSVFNIEKNKKIDQTVMQYAFDKKEAATKAEQEKKDIQQRNIRNYIVACLAGTLIFLVVVYRQRIKISNEKKKSDKEKQRSDALLLNILPIEVAEELKATGTAKAKAFTMVTVMFTDFKDFTHISEKVSAEMLVAEIHYCFSAFDSIIQRNKIEKIKTIGDAYLCASGLPISNYTHAIDMLKAAFEIREFILQRKKEKEEKGEIPFELRIGIHTGPVVAGIVGVKKYAYDIWGDTVNIAARMEQNSEAGKINISSTTYDLVKAKFACTYRGKIEAKNKGIIDMYFVEN